MQPLTFCQEFRQLCQPIEQIETATLNRRASKIRDFLQENSQKIFALEGSEKGEFSSLLREEKSSLEGAQKTAEAGLLAGYHSFQKMDDTFVYKKELLFSPQGEIALCLAQMGEIEKTISSKQYFCVLL